MSATARRADLPRSLRNQVAPVSVAAQRTLPVLDPLETLLPAGLPRGTSLTVEGTAARSAAFALAAAAGRAGSWLAVLGLEGPGWRAAAELGVPLERIVHVDLDAAPDRAVDCVAAAVDGFDLVLLGSGLRLSATVERRLAARARERGAVLIGVHEPPLPGRRRRPAGPLSHTAELRVHLEDRGWQGLGSGSGRLTGRPVEIVVTGRRLPGRRRQGRLWLPGPDGTVTSDPPGTRPVPVSDPDSTPGSEHPGAVPLRPIGRSA